MPDLEGEGKPAASSKAIKPTSHRLPDETKEQLKRCAAETPGLRGQTAAIIYLAAKYARENPKRKEE